MVTIKVQTEREESAHWNKKKPELNHGTTQKEVIRNSILSVVVLFSFLGLSLFYFFVFFSISIFRELSFFIFVFLLLLSSGLIIYFLNIKIQRPPKDDQKEPNLKSIRIWWIVIKHSHHIIDLIEDEVKIGKRYICSGCYGTAIGFIIGEITCLIYFLNFNIHFQILGIFLFCFGMVMISLTFIKFIKPVHGFLRLTFNSGVPLGTWLILLGIDLIFKNGFVLLYFLMFIPFLFFQRMRISRQDHRARYSLLIQDAKREEIN